VKLSGVAVGLGTGSGSGTGVGVTVGEGLGDGVGVGVGVAVGVGVGSCFGTLLESEADSVGDPARIENSATKTNVNTSNRFIALSLSGSDVGERHAYTLYVRLRFTEPHVSESQWNASEWLDSNGKHDAN
jgi:hypothetical protein